MSEPLSAVEIEDVLSSIRRLVSEDLRPAGRAVPGTAAPGPALDAVKPALILTPALRVVPDAAPAPAAEPVRPAVPIQQVVASVGAAVVADGQDWEPETGDAAMSADPVWAETAWQDEDAALSVDDSGPDADAQVDFDADADVVWAQAGEIDADVVIEPQPAAPADAEWLDQAEAEVIAGLEGGRGPEPAFAADDGQDYGPAFGSDFGAGQDAPEMSFDEEVLRDLVRDLIREELQGHLGERITRNIRKLVRAEIARALAVQDLT